MDRQVPTEYTLNSPVRLSYFNGKVLTADDFRTEQEYFVGKDRRHNCCVHGTGVVCGLGVTDSADGALIVDPGIALDPLGREIIVPEAHRLDPRLLTDEEGRRSRGPRVDGTFTLCLEYREVGDEMTRTATGSGQETVTTRTTETYRLLIRDGAPSRREADLATEGRTGLEASDVRLSEDSDGPMAEAVAPKCCPSDDDCVVLGTIILRGGKASLDSSHRQQLYSTAVLQEQLSNVVDQASCGGVSLVPLVSPFL